MFKANYCTAEILEQEMKTSCKVCSSALVTAHSLFRKYCRCYVMPYLLNADHMEFQIPYLKNLHYHNHLDTYTARQQGCWQLVETQSPRRAGL